MRLRIDLDDDLIALVDERVGTRGRSAFIADALRHALDNEQRWEDIDAGLGTLSSGEHEWDADPAGWVRAQRRSDAARVG